MINKEKISFEELASIYCMETAELKDFLKSRNFNLQIEEIDGEESFLMEDVQEHLQSQYFI